MVLVRHWQVGILSGVQDGVRSSAVVAGVDTTHPGIRTTLGPVNSHDGS